MLNGVHVGYSFFPNGVRSRVQKFKKTKMKLPSKKADKSSFQERKIIFNFLCARRGLAYIFSNKEIHNYSCFRHISVKKRKQKFSLNPRRLSSIYDFIVAHGSDWIRRGKNQKNSIFLPLVQGFMHESKALIMLYNHDYVTICIDLCKHKRFKMQILEAL